MHISLVAIMIITGKMSLTIPEHLKKFVIMSQDGTIIDKFKCPVPYCDYNTRLGPGAVRMHIIIKADPMSDTRYCPDHEEYYRQHEAELSPDTVRELAAIPYRPVSYKKR